MPTFTGLGFLVNDIYPRRTLTNSDSNEAYVYSSRVLSLECLRYVLSKFQHSG